MPAVPGQTRGLERGAQRPRREVEEVLARLVVVPEPAEEPRLHAPDVRGDEVNDPARHEQAAHRGERRDRIGEVLDRVVERDHVEARLGQVQLLEPARGHAEPALARALRRERRDLDALDVPSRSLGFAEEDAERAPDVEKAPPLSVPLLDRVYAIAEGAAGYASGEGKNCGS